MPCCCAQAAQRIQFVGNAMRILRNSVCEPHCPVRPHALPCVHACGRTSGVICRTAVAVVAASTLRQRDRRRARGVYSDAARRAGLAYLPLLLQGCLLPALQHPCTYASTHPRAHAEARAHMRRSGRNSGQSPSSSPWTKSAKVTGNGTVALIRAAQCRHRIKATVPALRLQLRVACLRAQAWRTTCGRS
jgi:hypothetical protein